MVHSLLRALRAKTPAFGAWLTFPSVHTARQIAIAGRTSGLSWVCIDCEHGLTALVPGVAETIAGMTTLPGTTGSGDVADGPQGPSVLVRVPSPGVAHSRPSVSHQIKQALDAGAHGIIVPMVANAEIARQVALDARFPPVGE
jgi:4-hydroxy-2-oxoheptanedioate aldolase